MNTHNMPFCNMKKKNNLKYPKSAAMGFFQGTQERVRKSRGKEPSMFELLKFCCIYRPSAYNAETSKANPPPEDFMICKSASPLGSTIKSMTNTYRPLK